MSSLLNLSMPSSKKQKNYANSRARRQSSGTIISSQNKKSKKSKEKEKDIDTESVNSSNTAESVVESKCPLRLMTAGMFEMDKEGVKKPGCPLRRVRLWHTIPLVLLAIINLLLVIVALLSLAGYRIVMGLKDGLIHVKKSDVNLNTFASRVSGTDDGATAVEGKE